MTTNKPELTDQERLKLLSFANLVRNAPEKNGYAATRASEIILAKVEPPAPTLAEGLRYRATLLDNGDPDGDTPQVLRTLADRAEQMEKDLTEATQQVKDIANHEADLEARLKATERERDRLIAISQGIDVSGAMLAFMGVDGPRMEADDKPWVAGKDYRVGDKITAADDLATKTPNPADVPPGEAWEANFWYGDERHPGTAIKTAGGDWVVVREDGSRNAFRMNEYVELVSRLVPAPRVITDPDELDKLPTKAIVVDHKDGDVCQKREDGCWYVPGEDDYYHARAVTPVTVLWEPEVTH